MPAPDPFAPFLEPLERLALPYCVTGSVAASVYGEPRLTADIDVVLLLKAQDIEALRSAFPEAGYYVPPEEKLREELARNARGMFNLVHHKSHSRLNLPDLERRSRESCDLLVRVPMRGEVESLNVSVSAGVCLFESVRRRRAQFLPL